MRWWLGLGLLAGCAATGAPRARTGGPSIFHPAVDSRSPAGAVSPSGSAPVLVREGRSLPAREAGADPRARAPGAPISLDLVDADLHHVLHLFGSVAGVDFVVADNVQARVTLHLEAVPWNHALAALLQSHGLAAERLPRGGWVVRAAVVPSVGGSGQP